MRKALGVLLIACLPFSAGGQDKSKKAYELIYQDVQLLKQQYLRLEKKVDDASVELKAVRDMLKDLTAQFKLLQTDQARSQENIKNLPAQVQIFLEKMSQLETLVLKVSEDLAEVKARPTAEPAADQARKDDKTPSSKKTDVPKKGESGRDKPNPGTAPPQTNLLPQDVYNTAYADYQKGTYELAIDGFSTFLQQFPSNPLADDAQFMIGECLYSQKKFPQAIEQFDELVAAFPASNKLATAYLKKGFSLTELKKKDEALAVLRFLVSKYPLDEEAKSAQQKIKEILEGK